MNNIRTLGDGMDSTLLAIPSIVTITKSDQSPIKVNTSIAKEIFKSLKPIEPKSKVCYLVPKYVPKERKVPKYLIKKPKEPKFIPYEPYKAAVRPIISNETLTIKAVEAATSRNNVAIQELVSQMSQMREVEMKKNVTEDCNDDTFKLRLQWGKEKEGYEIDIKNLRETNSHLENQLKFQAQVNSELKTLLVAAVGEDLESRVQHLTEDKLSLARALLNSANHLTSHQEQTEWLSGQCEVWRSKFLASSLMVEELAKWKSALANRINDLQEIIKALLEERRKIHNQALKTYNSLKSVAETMTDDGKHASLKYGNIVEIVNINQELSECLRRKLDLKYEDVTKLFLPNKTKQYTIAEKAALKLLQNPVTVTNKQDALCNAVMGAATLLGGKQMFLQTPSLHACCSHCKGEVQNI